MLYSEIMAVYCKNHTGHKLCGQSAGFLLLNRAVRIQTASVYRAAKLNIRGKKVPILS
jgi:hypothetical protein